MRKDEVEFHSEGFGGGSRPAVNVKVYNWPNDPRALFLEVGKDNGYDETELARWYDEDGGEQRITSADWLFEAACELGWEQLQTDAEEVFGSGVKVYSQGRSGGWAVVDGLPEFESWDAIMLGKWARFARFARVLADDVPYQMMSLAVLNMFEPDQSGLVKVLTS